jgi:SAM-dependent methyltransferase
MQSMRSSVSVEDVRRYWDNRPCNVRHGTARVGTLEWSRQVTARKYLVEPHIPAFADFPRWRGKRVLEIGCGIGTDTLEFVKNGARVVAVDLSEESLHLASDRFEVEGLLWKKTYGMERPVTFYCLDAEAYLPIKSFDLAYSFGVLHHTPNPERALANIFRSLKPGGELRIMLYARFSLKFMFGEQPEAQAGCPLARTYTAASAAKLVRRAGFAVDNIWKDHIFPWRVKDYVHHRYVKRLPYRWLPAAWFAALEKKLGHHLLVVARRPL